MPAVGNATAAKNYFSIPSVSNDLLTTFNIVNLVVLAGLVSTLGIASNVISIVIFLKQGFKDTVNISLLALAVSDLCSLVTLQWMSLCRNPLFFHNVPILADEFQHLTGGWPHACFARITSWITMYITLERCLCVVIALKVKTLVCPKLAISVLVSIYVITILTVIPDYVTSYIDWKFDALRNRSMLGLIYRASRNGRIAALGFNLTAWGQISAFLAIIFFTAILVFKMKQNSKWRQSLSVTGQQSGQGVQRRDNKVVKMVTLIAIIYCVCLLPFMVNCIVTCIEPEFVPFGLYHNVFFAAWSFGFLFESTNSSVNILVYYNMSSKYRRTLRALFRGGGGEVVKPRYFQESL